MARVVATIGTLPARAANLSQSLIVCGCAAALILAGRALPVIG